MTRVTTGPVNAAQIADLPAWARSLSDAGASADPAERAAYQAAKTALLANITQPGTDEYPQGTVRD